MQQVKTNDWCVRSTYKCSPSWPAFDCPVVVQSFSIILLACPLSCVRPYRPRSRETWSVVLIDRGHHYRTMKIGVFSKWSPDVTVNVHHEDEIVTFTVDKGDDVSRDDECEIPTLNDLIHECVLHVGNCSNDWDAERCISRPRTC